MEQDGTSYRENLYKRVRDKRHIGGAAPDTGPYETLFEREAKLGKQAGFTAIVLSKQRDSMIADLKDTKRWTETLANIYFFRLVSVPLPVVAALTAVCLISSSIRLVYDTMRKTARQVAVEWIDN